jgi:hypothetical protein
MGQMVLVMLPPIVGCKKLLNSTPHGLDCVGVIPVAGLTKETLIYGAVRVTDGPNIPVSIPAIADEISARFDPRTYYIHQYVGGFVRYGNKECSTGFTFNTAKHPLSLNRVSPMIFTPTELALIDFDGLVRTANLFRAALQEYQHSLSAKHTPVGNRVGTEVMFMLNVVDRIPAQDVRLGRVLPET